MMLSLACIVEGHGDFEAVPILVRRIAAEWASTITVDVAKPPIRVPRGRLLKAGELERYVELAARKAGQNGAVLILIDSDTDCPAHLGPQLYRRAVAVRDNLPIGVVLAKHEFEAWFLAAAESLRGKRGIASNFSAPPDPEGIQGAKEYLANFMEGGKYSEVLDQPVLTANFDLAAARTVKSFDKCYRKVIRLLSLLRDGEQTRVDEV